MNTTIITFKTTTDLIFSQALYFMGLIGSGTQENVHCRTYDVKYVVEEEKETFEEDLT